MNTTATFVNEDGTKTTFTGEQAWLMLLAKTKPYAGAPQLKQLPATKKKYSGKNPAGGRKAIFSQSTAYKKKPRQWDNALDSGITSIATPWYGWKEKQFNG